VLLSGVQGDGEPGRKGGGRYTEGGRRGGGKRDFQGDGKCCLEIGKITQQRKEDFSTRGFIPSIRGIHLTMEGLQESGPCC